MADAAAAAASVAEEANMIQRMATRRQENHAQKREIFAQDPHGESSPYALKLNPAPSKKPRGAIKTEEILVKQEDEDQVPSAEQVAAVTEQLCTVDSDAGVASSAQTITEAERVARALRLVNANPSNPIQPLSKFFSQNLAGIAAARLKQKEQLKAAAAASTTTAAAAAAMAPPPAPSATSLSLNKRKSTLTSKAEVAAPPASASALPELPLHPTDPAARTLNQIDLQCAMLTPFLEQVVDYVMRKAEDFSDRLLPTPDMLEPEHVDWCHTEAFPPYVPCVFGRACAGMSPQRTHPEGQFPYVQYVPPRVRRYVEETGKLPEPRAGMSAFDRLDLDERGDPIPTFCLECLTKILIHIYYNNIADDRHSSKIYAPFQFPVGTIGGYVPAAMLWNSDSRTQGLTTPLRQFASEQFDPCRRTVLVVVVEVSGKRVLQEKVLRGHAEKDCVKYFSESRSRAGAVLEGRSEAVAPSAIPYRLAQPTVSARTPAVYAHTQTAAQDPLRTSLLKPSSGAAAVPLSGTRLDLAPPPSAAAAVPTAPATAAASGLNDAQSWSRLERKVAELVQMNQQQRAIGDKRIQSKKATARRQDSC